MNRRNALKYTASVMGVSILGADIFLTGCAPRNDRKDIFSEEDLLLLDEIGETILPESERSPGARAAHIGAFMKTIVTDCYAEEDQQIFKQGMEEIRQSSKKQYGDSFQNISAQNRLDLLSEFDRQAKKYMDEKHPHFFSMMKQLTIWGYFSSEPGVTTAMRYDPNPGKYDGCVPYKNGDRAWYGPLSSIG